MIDEDVFAREWAEMDQHFPGDRAESEARRYYRHLNERMDTETFVAAADALYTGPREHFPEPFHFIEAAGGVANPKERALEQQEIVQELMRDWRRADLDRLDETAKRAVKSVGGIKTLALAPTDKVKWKLKTFRENYVTMATGEARRDELPPMTEEGRRLVTDAIEGELEA